MAEPTRSQIILVGQRQIRRFKNQMAAAKKKGVRLKAAEEQLAVWEAVSAKGYTFARLTSEEKEIVQDTVEEDEASGWDD